MMTSKKESALPGDFRGPFPGSMLPFGGINHFISLAQAKLDPLAGLRDCCLFHGFSLHSHAMPRVHTLPSAFVSPNVAFKVKKQDNQLTPAACTITIYASDDCALCWNWWNNFVQCI